jgi:hypothetical protein
MINSLQIQGSAYHIVIKNGLTQLKPVPDY